MKSFVLALCLMLLGCSAVNAEYNIQIRRDTAARWATYNPVLKAGELGCEQNATAPYDCAALKVGNGTQTWSALPYLVQPKVGFRGALVKVNGNTTDIINWTQEVYDTSNIHSTTTNTSRLTVPVGVTKVRVTVNLPQTDPANYTYVWIYKNGVSTPYAGEPVTYPVKGSAYISSGVLAVTAGDYFEVYVPPNDALNGITGGAFTPWFAMEVIE